MPASMPNPSLAGDAMKSWWNTTHSGRLPASPRASIARPRMRTPASSSDAVW